MAWVQVPGVQELLACKLGKLDTLGKVHRPS